MEKNKKDTNSCNCCCSMEDRISELVSAMTLEEKVSLCHANEVCSTGNVERLGIPALVMSDGPHGIREEIRVGDYEPLNRTDDYATYFTSAVAMAATWNTSLAREFGEAIADEARARGKDVLLGPGINIIRTPICGRNFEYYSEDPYLVSKLVPAFIQGVQNRDVAACVKHFAANNQEVNRYSVNVEMDERALHEIYLPGFKAAVQEGQALTVMGAYNKFRGRHCSHNSYLLKEILKGKWEFDGIVISDWGGTHDMMEAANDGLDVEMGTVADSFDKYFLATSFLEAIKSGIVKEDVLDDKVRRILRTMFKLKMFDENRNKGTINTPEHQRLSLNIAREAITLLKNESTILPLDADNIKNIAVIGENAEMLHGYGGGSSQVKTLYEISPLQGLIKLLGDKVTINVAPGYSSKPGSHGQLLEEAVQAASQADVVLMFAGLNHTFDQEGYDKADMKLPYGQSELISEVCRVNPKTVVVMVSGSPVEMEPWIHSVPAVLQAWYCGIEAGNAIAEVLFGAVNPSGKLTVTFPKKLEDSPAHRLGEYPGTDTVHYNEGLFVGYRYYDTYGVQPLFCFGHGLSYTTYSYGDLRIIPSKEGQGDEVEITFNIENTGNRAGAEIVQVYIRDVESSLPRPYKELKRFEKVFLKPGENKQICFTLDKMCMSYYDPEKKDWILEPGEFEVLVGSSSQDIRLKESFRLI